jgi:hypothetical protein
MLLMQLQLLLLRMLLILLLIMLLLLGLLILLLHVASEHSPAVLLPYLLFRPGCALVPLVWLLRLLLVQLLGQLVIKLITDAVPATAEW